MEEILAGEKMYYIEHEQTIITFLWYILQQNSDLTKSHLSASSNKTSLNLPPYQ